MTETMQHLNVSFQLAMIEVPLVPLFQNDYWSRSSLEGIDQKALFPSVTFRDLLYEEIHYIWWNKTSPVCLRLVPLLFACG